MQVNRTQSFHLCGNNVKSLTSSDLEEAAIQILHMLRYGFYTDPAGRKHWIEGDMTKVRLCKGLSDASRKLLSAIEHTSRRVEGTQEVRRLMRWNLQSFRVVYGQCIFVTFAPAEKHSLLMIRLSRVCEADPIWLHKEGEGPYHSSEDTQNGYAAKIHLLMVIGVALM